MIIKIMLDVKKGFVSTCNYYENKKLTRFDFKGLFSKIGTYLYGQKLNPLNQRFLLCYNG